MTSPTPLLNVLDYETRTRETLPRALFDRLFGTYGDPDWVTNTANVAAFDAVKLRPRVLVDVTNRQLSTEVLGQKISFPVMLAPAGTHQWAHPRGELASAAAAGAVGTVLSLSTHSSYSIEEVADVATGPLWFQLYFSRDLEVTETLVRRAQQAGYSALLLTVDQQHRNREREFRHGYPLDNQRTLKNFVDFQQPDIPSWETMGQDFDLSLSWSRLEWLRNITTMPLVIKGVQTAEDARLCVEHGVDALIVSNHGGHAVQGTMGTIDMLPEVVDAVGERLEVYLDGGLRRGTDVLKALALGAKAVFVGRAMFWGLAVGGEDGVRRILEILRDELDVAMILCGVTDVKTVDSGLVSVPNGRGQRAGVASELERMAGLVDRGYLTRAEFDVQKAKLLGDH